MAYIRGLGHLGVSLNHTGSPGRTTMHHPLCYLLAWLRTSAHLQNLTSNHTSLAILVWTSNLPRYGKILGRTGAPELHHEWMPCELGRGDLKQHRLVRKIGF
jgi:hypothetical protein